MHFQKISLDVFESLSSSQEYLETEINGHGVIVAWGGPLGHVKAIYYKKAGFASFSLDVKTDDYLVFAEEDTLWPYN